MLLHMAFFITSLHYLFFIIFFIAFPILVKVFNNFCEKLYPAGSAILGGILEKKDEKNKKMANKANESFEKTWGVEKNSLRYAGRKKELVDEKTWGVEKNEKMISEEKSWENKEIEKTWETGKNAGENNDESNLGRKEKSTQNMAKEKMDKIEKTKSEIKKKGGKKENKKENSINNEKGKNSEEKNENKKNGQKNGKEIEIDVLNYFLIPKVVVLTEKEKEELLKKFNIKEENLPKIRSDDPLAKALKLQKGQVIKITRDDGTGTYDFYRICI